MAVTKTITARGSKNHHTFELTFVEQDLTQEDIQLNRSRINYTLKLTNDNDWYWAGMGETIYFQIYGNNEYLKYDTIPNYTLPTQILTTDTFAVTHENDGSKTIPIVLRVVDNSGRTYTCGNVYVEDTMTLSVISRGFTQQPTLSPRNLQETTLDVAWSTSETASKLKIYLDDVLVETKNVDGKSGTFQINGTAGSGPHTLYYWATRKDTSIENKSEVYSDWSFYNYPYIKTIGSNPLIIGNQQTLTLYNPLGRNVTIKMYKNNTSGTQLYSGTTSTIGQSVAFKFTPTASTLYNSIPNDSSANCVYSVIGVTTQTTETAIYQIKGDELPTFSDTNWSYSANLTSLTNNNQVAIDRYSTITATINTPATSNYGANIDKYVVEWGNATPININEGSTSGSILNGNGSTLKISAFDKRGLSQPTQKTITNIPYEDINISNASTPRDNGVEATVKLNVSGIFYNAKFGTNGVQNAIYSAKYYVSTDGTTWSSGYTIPTSSFTTSNNYFNLSNYTIHANGSSGGFAIGTGYYVKVEVKDGQGLLGTSTYITRITDGKIARDVYKDFNGDYHEGINGLADSNYTEKVYGNINATNGFVGDLTGNATSATSSTNATKWNNLSDDRSTLNTTDTWVPVYASDKMQHTLRAIWTSKTHTNHGTNKEYLATLSTLTYWNGAYNSSNASNLTYAHQGTIQCKPTSLYDNGTGSTGNVTLSQTAANFTFLQIFYYIKSAGNVNYGSTCVFSPNNKRVGLVMTQSDSGSLVIGSCIKTISGTSITNVYNGTYNSFGRSAATNEVYIYKVFGWK